MFMILIKKMFKLDFRNEIILTQIKLPKRVCNERTNYAIEDATVKSKICGCCVINEIT